MNGVAARRQAGLGWLLRPKVRTKLNRARQSEGRLFKGLMLGFVGTFFWGLIFVVIFRMLLYFRGTQGIGDVLSAKLLGLAFVTFLMILVLSNVITALSTFFLSDDLELVVAAPVDPWHVYAARLGETHPGLVVDGGLVGRAPPRCVRRGLRGGAGVLPAGAGHAGSVADHPRGAGERPDPGPGQTSSQPGGPATSWLSSDSSPQPAW